RREDGGSCATPALLGPSRFLEQPADREDGDPDGRHNQEGLQAGPVAGVPRDRHRQKDHPDDLKETPQLVEEHTSFLPAGLLIPETPPSPLSHTWLWRQVSNLPLGTRQVGNLPPQQTT